MPTIGMNGYTDDFPPGYRFDLEDQDSLAAHSTPFLLTSAQGVGDDQWTELNVMDWWQVYNQGNMGSCQGWDKSQNAKLLYAIKAGAKPDIDEDGNQGEPLDDRFSAMWMYLETQRIDGLLGDDNGSTIEGGLKVMANKGCAREAAFPYPNPVQYSTRVPRAAADDAAKFKIKRYTNFRRGKPTDAMAWLGTGQGGLSIGIQWPPPFESDCPIITGRKRYGRSGGGHAICGNNLLRGETLIRAMAKDFPAVTKYVKDSDWVVGFTNSHGVRAQWYGKFFVNLGGMEFLMNHPNTSLVGLSDLDGVKQVIRRASFADAYKRWRPK